MDLLTLFEQLDECRANTSVSAKGAVLGAILESENADVFKLVASFVYNPYRKAHIKVTEDVLCFASDLLPDTGYYTDIEAWGKFTALLSDLESRRMVGNAARNRVASFFARIPDEYHDYFTGIINKDLKIGVGRTIVERYIPNLAPKFDVQLCPSKQWDGVSIPRGGFLVSPKIDGIRGVVGPFSECNGKFNGYTALSRNGHELSNTDHIVEELSRIAEFFCGKNDVWPVFDGEFYTHGWELSSSITSTKTTHPEAEQLQYHVFDILTYPEWVHGKSKAEAHLRYSVLRSALGDCSDSIVRVPALVSTDSEEAQMISQAYVDDGYEGSILKGFHSLYEFKRSKAWQKYKPFHDVDVKVTKLVNGWLDSAGNLYEDDDPRASGTEVVRSLVIDVNGVETQVGTGLSQHQRAMFAQRPERVVGKTITVRYQRVSEDGKLIFPRFKGVRTDK